MKERLGSLECINIIREAYFKKTIKNFVNKNKKTLIIGGGTGDSLCDYCEAGLKITFTDITLDFVNYTKKRYANNNYDIEYNCCSAYMLPYEDNSYEVVVSTLNGSYFNKDSLKEFRRVLKKDGILIISETTPQYIKYLKYIGRYNGKYILSSDLVSRILHPYVYSKQSLLKLLGSFDFLCLKYDILRPKELICKDDISEVILGFARYLNINVCEVPILYYMILKKGDTLK